MKKLELPIFLLLHGWGVEKTAMEPLEPIFQRFGDVCLLDVPGFGQHPLNEAFTIERYVDFLKTVLQPYQDRNIFLVGHSFGGKLAAYYALKYSLAGIILLSPSVYHRRSLRVKLKILFYKIGKKFHLKMKKWQKGSEDYRMTSGALRQTFLHVVHRYLCVEEMKKIGCPVLLFGFDKDASISIKDCKKMARSFAKCTFHILKGDHFGYLENGLTIGLAVQEWLLCC